MKRFRDLLERIPLSKAEPLEVREAILAEIEETLVVTGVDGRRRLSNCIRITLLSSDPARRKQLRRALSAEGGLKKFLTSRGAGQDIEVSSSLAVSVEEGLAEDPQYPNGFRIEGWNEEIVPVEAPSATVARLAVVATGQTVQLGQGVFRIGREKQPQDRSGRPKPANDLYFGEKELSVSRHHAQISFDAGVKEYRLWDVGSTQGTKILREGLEIDVPKSLRSHGERLRPGDLIYFGKVGVRFEVL
jgi:hypothetical protein